MHELIQQPYEEGASLLIEFTLLKEDDTPVVPAEIFSFKLTLWDKRTRNIINSRDHQNILNSNGGSVDSQGGVKMQLVAADAALQGQNLTKEVHLALFEWTWASGARSGKLLIEFTLRNLIKVT